MPVNVDLTRFMIEQLMKTEVSYASLSQCYNYGKTNQMLNKPDVYETYKDALSVFKVNVFLTQMDELAHQRWGLLTCLAKNGNTSHHLQRFMIMLPYRDRKLDLLTLSLCANVFLLPRGKNRYTSS